MTVRKLRRMKTPAQVYAMVPEVNCKGLCWKACGPIGLTAIEADQLQDNGINLPVVVDHPVNGPLTCSHLTADRRCAIYSQRPLICRLYGAVRKMACPHGCTPVGGYLSDEQAFALAELLDDGRPTYYAFPR